MRYKLITTVFASALLFWGPSIGSSGVTDAMQSGAVPSGAKFHRSVFGWHTEDPAETVLLAGLNSTVFEFTAKDSKKLLGIQAD